MASLSGGPLGSLGIEDDLAKEVGQRTTELQKITS